MFNRAVSMLVLFVWFMSSSPAWAWQTPLPAPLLKKLQQNWLCVALSKHEGQTGLCVIRGQYTYGWFRIDSLGRVMELPLQPASAPEVSQMVLSDNERQLASIFAEEGHPVLVVLNVHKVLQNKSAELFTRGLYPGSLSIECWSGSHLILDSDQNLTGPWHDPSPHITGGGTFKLDPASQKISRLNKSPCGKK